MTEGHRNHPVYNKIKSKSSVSVLAVCSYSDKSVPTYEKKIYKYNLFSGIFLIISEGGGSKFIKIIRQSLFILSYFETKNEEITLHPVIKY